ncbi:DUF4436 family protein [Nocardia sp. NPDC004722]
MRRFDKIISAVLAVTLVALGTVCSLSLYRLQEDHGRPAYLIGDTAQTDRIDIDVVVVRVDPAAGEMAVQVTPTPHGRFDDGGRFTADTTVYTAGLKSETIRIRTGEAISTNEIRIPLNSGTVTDYPFDDYRAQVAFAVEVDAAEVPMNVSLYGLDAFFRLTPHVTAAQHGDGLNSVVDVERSVPSVVFALFVMALMLGLAVAAATAAFFVLRGRHGLVWPAMTLMAAMLFAMIPLRNAVPGAPPIGSIIDFGSFFIAEAVVALSLICTVLIGYRQEVGRVSEE